ncbi:FeS assembly SUF system protein [Anseongella ginsenosidimutans]|uniref:FeS assembly SUF system protein n=1 Tax=Anseongella ginsenosidimutans TaxID=496056 RepID=A0A4R3KT69_9SPHI|nr:iron-sulfur cluster assembly protein [Anseongella ginsenosidimutans]QEC53320.1 DUF59 domain-containing protein [Anseongella ginsenosidimutans]TCS88197.1 FeS assembly SUF system protein [Anseongella ginsenosidimutans]
MEEENKEKTLEQLREDAIEAVKTCYDPEIPVNIYELGLIYELNITPERNAEIIMTLTSPFCPVAGTLPEEVRQKVQAVEGIREAALDVVFDPPWDKEMMSEEAKLQLGFL